MTGLSLHRYCCISHVNDMPKDLTKNIQLAKKYWDEGLIIWLMTSVGGLKLDNEYELKVILSHDNCPKLGARRHDQTLVFFLKICRILTATARLHFLHVLGIFCLQHMKCMLSWIHIRSLNVEHSTYLSLVSLSKYTDNLSCKAPSRSIWPSLAAFVTSCMIINYKNTKIQSQE